MKNEMKINVKVNEKDVLEETYTITLDRDEIEQVEQAFDRYIKINIYINQWLMN